MQMSIQRKLSIADTLESGHYLLQYRDYPLSEVKQYLLGLKFLYLSSYCVPDLESLLREVPL